MSNASANTLVLCDKALHTGDLSKEEIMQLLESPEEFHPVIFEAANTLRDQEVGNDVHLRGLIEFSNYCKRVCKYCGIRSGMINLKRYRMEIREIIEASKNAEGLGYRSVVLQSGEDPYFNADRLCEIVTGIKEVTDLAITLSAGEYSYGDYKKIYESGADRYLLRFETSDEASYQWMHPDSSLQERLSCLYALREIGYQVGSGFMVGLPGETSAILADNLLLLKKLDVDMVGIGPFIPSPGTPMSNENGGTFENTLLTVALTRLILRNVHIPATTAMGSLEPGGRELTLKAGANVVMPNVTPLQYRELYQLYPNKICLQDDPVHCRKCITGKITAMGRTISTEHGHSLKRGENNNG